MNNVLIIGGTSGLGYELAKKYEQQGCQVYITGRSIPSDLSDNISFVKLDLGNIEGLELQIRNFITSLDIHINTFVYAAGVFHRGKFDEINSNDFTLNVSVNYLAPQILLREIIQKQGDLQSLVGISSIAQFRTPEDEPYYSSNKSGFGKFIEIVSQDSRITKTLLISPAGMSTPFWRDHPKSREKLAEYLDPVWVAGQIILLLARNKKYQSYLIERSPARLVLDKTRD